MSETASLIGRKNAEEDISIESSDCQSGMAYLLRKEKWKEGGLLSSEIRTRIHSLLHLFEMNFQKYLQQEKLNGESCDNMGSTADAMRKLLKDAEFRRRLEKTGLKKSFQTVMGRLNSKCKSADMEYPLFEDLRSRSQYLVSMGYTAFRGDFHCSFNQHFTEFVPKQLSQTELNSMKNKIQREYSRIFRDLRRLYAVTGTGNRKKMSVKSLEILQMEELNIHSLSSICSEVCAYTRAVLRGDFEGDAKKAGQLDLLAGKMARGWILLVVFSLFVLFLTFLSKNDLVFSHVTDKVRRLAFTPKNKKPQIVSPKNLWSQSKKYDGKLVQVSGFVRNISRTVSKGGFKRNILEVFLPGSNNFIRSVAIFEEMDSIGPVNSAYVQLIGTWRHSSKITRTPVLQLERLKISERKDQFGFDFVLDAIRPWFDFFPSSCHLYWSVRPQGNNENLS